MARGNGKVKGKELAPPTTMLGKAATRLVDCIEDGIRRHSVYGDRPIYPTDWFPWARHLEQDWRLIRAELDAVLKRRQELPAFHELSSAVKTITQDQHWKTFPFYGYGMACPETCQACPHTARLLQGIPGMLTAFFSILSPRKHIPAHRGPYNGVLRFHLGLQIPEQRSACRIRIDDQICHWREGEALVFDDCFDHEVWNDTDEERVVLFVDFIRPTRFPMRWLNETMLRVARHTPLLQEVDMNTKVWAESFFGDDFGSGKIAPVMQPQPHPHPQPERDREQELITSAAAS